MVFGGSDTVSGWLLAIAIDGASLVGFGLTMFFALRGKYRSLQRRGVGDFATGVVMLVSFCGLFIGVWLPVGVVLGARRVWRMV
jgi:hypothetical protein